MDNTPGLGVNLELLIFKEDENVVYIARDRGSGFAHSGLLSWKQLQSYTRSIINVPCSDEQSDRLEKSLKVV